MKMIGARIVNGSFSTQMNGGNEGKIDQITAKRFAT